MSGFVILLFHMFLKIIAFVILFLLFAMYAPELPFNLYDIMIFVMHTIILVGIPFVLLLTMVISPNKSFNIVTKALGFFSIFFIWIMYIWIVPGLLDPSLAIGNNLNKDEKKKVKTTRRACDATR